jgi:integrase
MPKKSAELGPLHVSKLKDPGLHAVGGVAGLHLQIMPSGARSWILRIMVGGRRRDMGLGGYPDVTLSRARDAARDARDVVRKGQDPIADARAARSALLAAEAKAWTFEQCAEACIKAKAPEWKNAKHEQQWRNTLKTYAYPVIGSMLVRDVTETHVTQILEKDDLWTTKTETATRLRTRIEAAIDWAIARRYRDAPNPARWRGLLDKLLPKPNKLAKVVHHAALPAADMPAFMKSLRAAEGMGARALEFAILTAARSGEVRGATWPEIDLDAGLWTIPGERMKAGREHRVPLSKPAVALLKGLTRLDDTEVVFYAPRGGQLSDMTLTAVCRRMCVDAVPHGFRSTFRDWTSERTNYPREVCEMALAHTIDDKVEAAYRRGDLFTKRQRMMAEWAAFCAKDDAAKVVQLGVERKARRAGGA